MAASSAIQRDPIFPRSRLTTGESLVWEGRPSKIVYLVQPLILLVMTVAFGIMLSVNYDRIGAGGADLSTWIILGALLVLMPVSILRSGAIAFIIGVAIIIVCVTGLFSNGVISFAPVTVGLLALLYDYVVWTHTAFAITDRRILTQYGVFNIRFGGTRHDRISNVTVHQTLPERILGIGDVMFSTSGETGGIDSDSQAMHFNRKGAVKWEDVPNPFYVRKKAEGVMLNPSWQDVKVMPHGQYVPSPPYPPILPEEAEERLVKLKELLDKGLISQEEYDAKRQEIVSRL